MQWVIYALPILIAMVLVAAKLILEHEQQLDRAAGVEQPKEMYTLKGMLRYMREERRQKRQDRREERTVSQNEQSNKTNLPIKDVD